MATLLGTSFSTDKNVMVQTNVWLLRKTVESPRIEFDQEKFEEFLSSGSVSSKIMRQYHKVSSEIRSRISLEITPEVVHTTAHNAKDATSEEVLKTSSATYVNVSQETCKVRVMVHNLKDGEDQFRRTPPLQTLQFQVTGGSQ